jgi:hypothetical protein
MSAIGPKQTWPRALHMSAFGGKADIAYCGANVRYWPLADIPSCTAYVCFLG